MGRVAVIGAWPSVRGWALAGADVHDAVGPDATRAAWDGLAPDVSVVLVTDLAARDLAAEIAAPVTPGAALIVVIPS